MRESALFRSDYVRSGTGAISIIMADRAGSSPSTSGGETSHTEGNESDEQLRSTPPSKRMRHSCIFRQFLGPPIPGGDAHMHTAYAVAAIIIIMHGTGRG